MVFPARALLGTLLAVMALVVACSSGDAESDAGAVVVDPSCNESAVLTEPPSGTCLSGATCNVTVQPPCVGMKTFACSCPTGEWRCELTSAGLHMGCLPDAGTSACPVCEKGWFTCGKPGVESVSFQVESQNDQGCAGHIVQLSGPTDAYTIDCALGQVCGPVGCFAATITNDSFSWEGATCWAQP